MIRHNNRWTRVLVLALGLAPVATSIGCQASVGGQTLPSAYYLRDDVQYFPAGPEFKLTQQVRALEEYKLQQDLLDQDMEEAPPPSSAPPELQ